MKDCMKEVIKEGSMHTNFTKEWAACGTRGPGGVKEHYWMTL